MRYEVSVDVTDVVGIGERLHPSRPFDHDDNVPEDIVVADMTKRPGSVERSTSGFGDCTS